jgi:hypothetical protein
MNFQLNFSIPKSSVEIQHGDKISLMGSCFSDAMHPHFLNAGFEVISNPFGTLFHPNSIAEVIESSIDQSEIVNSTQRGDLFFSWDSASNIFGYSEEELKSNVLSTRQNYRSYLESAKVLVITFGTAWGYALKSSGNIAANCHKMPDNLFKKQLMDVTAQFEKWTALIAKIKLINPELEIIFTVSPVRHRKDGLPENNRSKGRLIELVHLLNEEKATYYFPSYEIVIDELRDYRFFKECRVHPTEEAVQYVWERFVETYFTNEAKELALKVRKLHRTFAHKILHPESADSKRHVAVSEKKLLLLGIEHPEIYWEE